jgi:2-dehydropantoate 2-reductase
MRLLIVGAGATGGYFGGRLAAAGRDVTFLVRPQRAVHLQAHGLQILSPLGDITLTPQLVTADTLSQHFDVVLLSVKAFALAAALDDMAAAVGPETMVLPVLNGMKHIDMLRSRFGDTAVIGGLCKIAATIDAQGRIVQLAKFHELAYGERDGAPSPRLTELDHFMQGAGFNARLSSVILPEMWEKWLFLASLAGITCLMRGTIGETAAAPGGADFARQFIAEVAAIVTAAGMAPDAKVVAETMATLTAEASPLTASMYRDLQQGNAIEADQIIGDLLARGQQKDVPTPLLAAAYAHLCVYQNRLTH